MRSQATELVDSWPRPLHIVTAAYGIVLSMLSTSKVFQFKTQSYDMAIFNQVFWNTLHGRFMFSMPECCYPAHPPNFLGAHVSPLILLLLPIYAIYQSPYTLLVIQSFALALPAVFIHEIAAKRLGERAAWAVVAAYLIYPGVLWPGLSDFHLEAFVPLAYVLTFYFWDRDRPTPFFMSFVFLLSTIEYAAAIGLAFLVHAWLTRRRSQLRTRIGVRALVILGILAVAWYASANFILQSVWPQRGVYLPNYWGPLNLGVDIWPKVAYWGTLLIPLAFAPLLAPLESLAAAPWFFASVFSNFPNYYTLPWQYAALVSGQLVIASIFALQKFNRLKLHRAMVALSFIALVALSPFGIYAMTSQTPFVPTNPGENVYAGHQALSVIPHNATVLAQDNLLPFLVDRQASVFSNYPNGTAPPDYIALEITQKYYFLHDPPDSPMQKQVQFFLGRYSYGLVASADGFLVYELGYRGPPLFYVPFTSAISAAGFNVLSPLSKGGSSIHVPGGFQGLAWNGPWDSLGPGQYRVTFFFDNLGSNSSLTLDSFSYPENVTISRMAVNFQNLGQVNATLNISLSGLVPQVEFRGSVGRGQSADLNFEGVMIAQMPGT